MLSSPSGQDPPNHHQHSHFKQPLNPANLFTCPFTNSSLVSLCSLPGTASSDSSILNEHRNNSNTSETDSGEVSDLIHATSSLSDDGLLISHVRGTSAASSPGHRSVDGSVDLKSKGKSSEGNGEVSEKEHGLKDVVKRVKNNSEDEERNEEQQYNREAQRKDMKEGGNTGEERGRLMASTADRADRREDSQRSTGDAGDTKQPETETKDSAEGVGTDGVEERGTTGPHTRETQIPAQTTADTTIEKSSTQQVIDCMDTEPPLAACEPSDCSQTVGEKVADSSHVNKGFEIRREVHICSEEHQSVCHGPNSVTRKAQHLCHDEAQTSAQDLAHQVSEKTTEEKPSGTSAPNIPSELSEPLNQSSIWSSQTSNAALPAQSNNIVCIQETTATQAQPCDPYDITSDMKQTDEMCDTQVREYSVLVRAMVEPQALPQSQEISEQQHGQLRSLITDDEDEDSSAYKQVEGQSNVDTHENNDCETAQEPVEESNLKDVCADFTMDTEETESETGSYREHVKNDEVEDDGDAKRIKTDVHPSLENENDALPETSSKKCYVESPAKEMPLEDTNELSLPSSKTSRSSFDWGSTQRRTVGTDVSVLHHCVQVLQLKHASITI